MYFNTLRYKRLAIRRVGGISFGFKKVKNQEKATSGAMIRSLNDKIVCQTLKGLQICGDMQCMVKCYCE